MTDAAEVVRNEEPEAEGERERSTIGFPYLDLDNAMQVAKAVSDVGGASCQWEQLAAQLKVSAKSGSFGMRVLTAKIFGLLTYDKGTVTLSEIGMRAVDSQQEKAARVEAFLNVPLYKRVYDQFKGTALPGNAGLENFMGSVGVAQKVRDKARQVFQRSAKRAGFFDLSADRLTLPAIRAAAKTSGSGDGQQGETDLTKQNRNGNGGAGGGGDDLNPFIKGLLDKLPKADTPWSKDGRRKWLQTAANIFDLMYESVDGDGDDEVSITVSKSSAK
jgi:hypothetical protein